MTAGTPRPARELRECTICGEKVPASHATEQWEERHRHSQADTPRPDLDALRTRAEAATEGPWERDIYEGVRNPKSRVVKREVYSEEFGFEKLTSLADYLSREDAEFIAHAREDVPILLAEVARLTAATPQLIEVHHHDLEAHAASFNEGYEAAMTQGLADDPSLAEDWLAAHDAEKDAAVARLTGERDTAQAEAELLNGRLDRVIDFVADIDRDTDEAQNDWIYTSLAAIILGPTPSTPPADEREALAAAIAEGMAHTTPDDVDRGEFDAIADAILTRFSLTPHPTEAAARRAEWTDAQLDAAYVAFQAHARGSEFNEFGERVCSECGYAYSWSEGEKGQHVEPRRASRHIARAALEAALATPPHPTEGDK